MSSLQCATTLLLIPDGGRAAGLTARLTGRRVAHVWTSPHAPAAQTARLVAPGLGVGVTTRPELRERGPEEPAADAVERIGGCLAEIADQHPGETVLVVSHDALRLTVPQWARMDVAPQRLTSAALIEVAVDADGRVCVAWEEAS